MEILTIMESIAKFFKNKLQFSLSKDYKIKVDKNNYILLKKEEDYEILFYLERLFLIYLRIYYLMMKIKQSEFFSFVINRKIC